MNEGRRKSVGLLGASVGSVAVHESGERPPLLATFVTHHELGGDVWIEESYLQREWLRAFDGNPPCKLICLMGGEIKIHYSEQDTIDQLRRKVAELEAKNSKLELLLKEA
jgi:hypothetical protein